MPRSWKSASVLRSNVMYTVHPKYLCSTDIQNIKNLMPPQIFEYANKCAVHPRMYALQLESDICGLF